MDEHDRATCPICQRAISEANEETAALLREGKLIVPHGQPVSRSEYPGLYDVLMREAEDA